MSDEREIEENKILNLNNEGLVQEYYAAREGAKLKSTILKMLGFKDYSRIFDVSHITGTRSQVDSFTKAVGGEKRYMKAVEKFGLNDPRTYASKTKLKSAVRNFERETGMKWPIK
jgi:hypothetical protein